MAVKAALAPYLPSPVAVRVNGVAQRDAGRPLSIGRMKSFHGHVGVLLRAYGYLRTMGAQGLREASENAVLNANYLQHQLGDMLPPVYDQFCKHETLLSGEKLNRTVFGTNFPQRLAAVKANRPEGIGIC